jgi:DNA-binding Lrp family transcriptional regulator
LLPEEIDYVNLEELKELSRPDMKALARQAIGQNYIHFADQLAAIAHDSPLVTVVGGRLLADQSIPPNLLERNEDFRRKVLSRFEDILIGQVSQLINPELCRKILRLIAATAPIKLLDKQFQQTATEFLDIDEVTLRKRIETLEKAGVLLRRGSHLRITPDVLADHILHTACLTDQGDSTGYAQKVFETFREIYPAQVLRNLAELDWRVRSSSEQETNLLNLILQGFREEFKQASNLDRCKLLDLIKEIAYYQPDYALDIVQFAIRHPATASEDESIPERYRFTHSYVLSKLPEILNRISYTLEYVPICCNLLWQLGRDDPSRRHNNPPESIRILIDLAKYGADKSIRFNEKVLEAIEQWLQEPDVHDHIYSPLDILDSFLEKKIRYNDYDGRNLAITTFLVDYNITQIIRGKTLKLIENLLTSNNIKVVLRALESLRKALEELRDRSGQPLEEANQWWEPEQLEILEMIHSLVIHDIEPLIQLRGIRILAFYAQHSFLEAIRSKSKEITCSIPKTYELKLTGILSNNYSWDFPNLKSADSSSSLEEYNQYIDNVVKVVAQSFLSKNKSPQDGFQILNERLQLIASVDMDTNKMSFRLLESIAEVDPSYVLSICEKIVVARDSSLAPYFASILCRDRVRKYDSKRAANIIQDAINSGTASLCSACAKTYYWTEYFDEQDSHELIKKLLDRPELEVKKSAIESLGRMQSQPKLANSLALNVETDEATELVEVLFQTLTWNSLDTLTDEDLEKLLHKLEKAHSLSGYYTNQFLVYTSKKIPSSVLQLILKRIEASVEKDEIDYDPLSLTYYENCLHHLSTAEEYEDMLRKIRDLWFAHRSQMKLIFSDKLELLYEELYKEASFTFVEESKRVISPTSLKLLNEWINSNNMEQIKLSSELINKFPSGFIFGNLEFVFNLLEKADKNGHECYEMVSRNLWGTVVSKVKTGIPGQPFPEDIQLRDQAAAIAKQFFKGSPIRKFFDSLVNQAESDIASQQIFYEERWE